jgi:hypothetical protein
MQKLVVYVEIFGMRKICEQKKNAKIIGNQGFCVKF